MRQELVNLINRGADIEFSVNGKRYTILPWTDGGINIGQQGPDDGMFFDDVEALLKGYIIDGTPLEMLLDNMHILFTA